MPTPIASAFTSVTTAMTTSALLILDQLVALLPWIFGLIGIGIVIAIIFHVTRSVFGRFGG
jgi:hypothetical protein